MKKLLREPLTHFVLLGALIFVAHAWREKDRPVDAPKDQLEVTAETIAWLSEGFAKQWQRAPEGKELRGLVEDHIREEVLYREALALGLDRNDTIVRRRMAQKMEFLSQDIAAAIEPEDEDLRKFFVENPARYARPAKLSFRHVYFSKERRGENLAADAKAALAALAGGADESVMGDPFLMPHEFENADASEITAAFGDAFSAEVTGMPEGEWGGPVVSSYGLHLVVVSGRAEPQAPDFDAVRDAVARDFSEERRREMNIDFIRRLKERYRITVDEAALDGADARSNATAIR